MVDKSNPVVLTYLPHDSEFPISVPIWTHYHDDKYYIMTSRSSPKVQSIEHGNTKVCLTIVSQDHFPQPKANAIPYLAIQGEARIATADDVPNIAAIEINLLRKYNRPGETQWVDDLISRLEKEPEKSWMIEITPFRTQSYKA